jgi:thymidylate synthase
LTFLFLLFSGTKYISFMEFCSNSRWIMRDSTETVTKTLKRPQDTIWKDWSLTGCVTSVVGLGMHGAAGFAASGGPPKWRISE